MTWAVRNKSLHARSAALVLLWVAACHDHEASAQPTGPALDGSVLDVDARPEVNSARCQGAYEELRSEVFPASEPETLALQACQRDTDCTTFSPSLRCSPDHSFDYCGIALAASMVGAAQSRLSMFEAELCPQVMRGCNIEPECATVQVRCERGQCALAGDAGTAL